MFVQHKYRKYSIVSTINEKLLKSKFDNIL